MFTLRILSMTMFRASLFTLLVLLQSCSTEDQSSNISAEPEIEVLNSCQSPGFQVDNRMLFSGAEIGRGDYGRVYELKFEDQVDSRYALKAIPGTRSRDIKKYVDDEVQLATDLSGFYTPIIQSKIYDSSAVSEFRYFGFLIKKRVNGHHLNEIANMNVIGGYINFIEATKNFVSFRRELIKKFDELAQRNIYIWDFHSRNVMYDTIENRWYLVDSLRAASWKDFRTEIEQLSRTADPSHRINRLWQHIKSHENGPPKFFRERFFRKYVDVYFDDYLKQLIEISGYRGPIN